MPKPPRAQGLADAFIDPAYGTRLYRASAAEEGRRAYLRHDYSRRQAFNADNTRYLARDGSGYWHLYDGQSFKHLREVPGFAGACEPLWHPSDARKVYLTSPDGGMVWWEQDVETGERQVLFDFTGQTPWPQARAFWTKGEGTLSADGRYLALMATSYDSATQRNTVYGLLMLDVHERRIVGTLDAADFPVPHAMPDHISTSASGRYAVPSWHKDQGGTRAYTRDFSSEKLLFNGSEHSDLAYGPSREDLFVHADYASGYIVAHDIDTGRSFSLAPLYPASGEAYAVHISGQAFDRPGWAVISTYYDTADYGRKAPAPTLRAQYRKVFLAELKPGGRLLSVAHTRMAQGTEKDYFAEPHASASRDLSRLIFSSNFGDGAPDDYIVGLPSVFDR